jgi:ketosteroid isomerase-like protein
MVSLREAIERGSLDDFAETLAADVAWIGMYPRELCRNRAEVLEMFTRFREQDVRVQPRIVAEQNDCLVVDAGLDGRHHVIVLDDGLVSEVRVYPDRGAALAAVEAAA